MNDLIEKLEGLEGPDREVDAEIFEMEPEWREAFSAECLDSLSDREICQKAARHAPRYTASIDAAMTLVPEGWRFGIEQGGQFDGEDIPEAWCWPWDSSFDPDWQNGQQGYRDASDGKRACAPTPAIALCIAALRAREASHDD